MYHAVHISPENRMPVEASSICGSQVSFTSSDQFSPISCDRPENIASSLDLLSIESESDTFAYPSLNVCEPSRG